MMLFAGILSAYKVVQIIKSWQKNAIIIIRVQNTLLHGCALKYKSRTTICIDLNYPESVI